MRVLLVHSYYQQRGGEDIAFEMEADLLEAAGIEVIRYTVDNGNIIGLHGRIKAMTGIFNNKEVGDRLAFLIGEAKPDLVHFHNTFPSISPGAVEEVLNLGTPAVMTLHNYRLICAGAMLLRAGVPCELCVGNFGFSGALHRCYRRSIPGSVLTASAGWYYRALSQQYTKTLSFIALTQFASSVLQRGGIPGTSMYVKGNTAVDTAVNKTCPRSGFLFAGRLSPEKGVEDLVGAAEMGSHKLTIIGEGPLLSRIQDRQSPNVRVLGRQRPEEVRQAMAESTAVIVPSKWYEGFPLVVVEAYAAGTPVIASRIGSLTELVQDGRTGLLVRPSDPVDLNAAMRAMAEDCELARRTADGARRNYEETYSPSANAAKLLEIYRDLKRKAQS